MITVFQCTWPGDKHQRRIIGYLNTPLRRIQDNGFIRRGRG